MPREDGTVDPLERVGATPSADATTGASDGVDWDRLPEPVRVRLAELAATAVGAMPPVDVPVPLRRLARFTPAKRARLGTAALTAALAGDPAFRAAVVAWWKANRAGELAATVTDPLTAAAAAVLAGDRAAAEAVSVAARRGEAGELRAERDAALSRVDKLTVELERLRGELSEARAQVRRAAEQRDVGSQQLRRRVSEQGSALRAAIDARESAEAALDELRRSAAAELAAARSERDGERDRADVERRRADRAAAEVAAARQAAREARKADEVRLTLLVDTLERGGRRPAPRAGAGRRRSATGRPRRRCAGRAQRFGRRRAGRPRRPPRGAVGAPDRRRLQRQQDRLPRASPRRPARPARRAARRAWPRAPERRSPSSSTGPGWSPRPRGARAGCGCCSATRACWPTT